MALTKVGQVNDLANGTMVEATVNGKEILIANLDCHIYAIGNKCTHMGCKLSKGRMDSETVKCPCHGSVFSLKTGGIVKGPATKTEPSYKVSVQNNELWVDA